MVQLSLELAMTDTPYPIPASARTTGVLTGNGGTVYGPFGEGWGIFDIADVVVRTKPLGATSYSEVSCTIAKVNPAAPYGTFTVTFPASLPATTTFVVKGRRKHKRSVAITRGGTINSVELERELSKQSVVLQEQRRDVDDLSDRAIAIPDGSAVSAPQLISEILQFGSIYLGAASANPTQRRDGTALQQGDFFLFSPANEHRYFNGTTFISGNVANTVASNVLASNPILASAVAGTVDAVNIAFTPQLPNTFPRFFRFASLGINAANPLISVDGGAGKTLRLADGTQLLAGQLGNAGTYIECIELADRVIVVNPQSPRMSFVPKWQNDAGSSQIRDASDFGFWQLRDGMVTFSLGLLQQSTIGFLTSVTAISIGPLPIVSHTPPGGILVGRYGVNLSIDNFNNSGVADPFLSPLYGVINQGTNYIKLWKRRPVDGAFARATVGDFTPYNGGSPAIFINGSYPV
jgi:hypothetical protein